MNKMNPTTETNTEIIFEGDLILTKDFTTQKNLIVKGNIRCEEGSWNINAGNINAGNINAGNINYYAVCFAYNNIVCNSINGTRENCKHFCLDGKITIKEETKCKTCGK